MSLSLKKDLPTNTAKAEPAITFKRFHCSIRLSQETAAYDTDVLFDGKKIGTCRNDGHGGEGFFHSEPNVDKELLKRAEAWAKQQPYLEDDGSICQINGKDMIVDSIEEYCDLLAEKTLADKDEMAQVKRILKKHATFLDPARNEIVSLKAAYSEGAKDAIEKRYPGAVILNTLSPQDALEAFREQNRRDRAAANSQTTTPRKPKP